MCFSPLHKSELYFPSLEPVKHPAAHEQAKGMLLLTSFTTERSPWWRTPHGHSFLGASSPWTNLILLFKWTLLWESSFTILSALTASVGLGRAQYPTVGSESPEHISSLGCFMEDGRCKVHATARGLCQALEPMACPRLLSSGAKGAQQGLCCWELAAGCRDHRQKLSSNFFKLT